MSWRRQGEAARELSAHLGRRVQVLTEGRGEGVVVLGLVDALGVRRDQDWELVEWHLIRHGHWDEEQRTLSWVLADDTSGSVVLSEPGRVPELFQERVKASIVVEDRTPAPGGGWILLVGRRSLAHSDDPEPGIVWQVLAEGAAELRDPQVSEHIVARVAALESDYSV